MQQHTLTVGHRSYTLDEHTDPDAISDALVTAAQHGGGTVHLHGSAQRDIRIIVTPGVPIVLETENLSDIADGWAGYNLEP